jgi:hypothetical protein
VPKTVKKALDFNRKNGNTFSSHAIAKEMKEACIAFNILPDRHVASNGYQRIPCHMVFDVKMEDFEQNARLVAGGHMTKAPALSPMPVTCHTRTCTCPDYSGLE